MRFADLVSLYFQQSNMLQTYWTVYVVVIGGLLAVAAIRKEPDFLAGALATLLYCSFAYKNMSALTDLTSTRYATLQSIQQYDPSAAPADKGPIEVFKANVVPTLQGPSVESVRTFHIYCDVITMATMWGLQLNRLRRHRRELATVTRLSI